jgi:DNA polymerase-3 subunit gamma/tau
MFQKSRTIIGTTPQNAPVATVAPEQQKAINNIEQTTATVAPNAETTAITDATLTQAWTSFALLLPENERALADRMKIMAPKIDGEGYFSISVDNQMAADLFTKEEKRICEGMKPFLGNRTIKMKVIVNKVVVERHVSDKSKQYAILVEKNPLIEKLRKELNLEVAR